MQIPFLDFAPMHGPLKKEMEEVFSAVYDSNWFVMGKWLQEFESAYATYSGSKHCIGVSNGLDALTLSLRALGIKESDEVIVPSNTYIASAIAVSQLGAKPVFVEPRKETFNIDPDKIADSITERTKAIMPVHLYGQACEMTEIIRIASTNGLLVVEDNAQSHGATYEGKSTGSWGNCNGTSFYPGKNLGALGDGGAVTTDSEEVAGRVRTLRNYGSAKKYYNEVIGYNNRLDELQAAFLGVKLKHINQWTEQRQAIAELYHTSLIGVGDLVLPQTAPLASHVYHLFVVRTSKRDELKEYLKSRGIGTLVHYPVPPHLQKAYSYLGLSKGRFPIAEEMAKTCLSLPMFPGLTTESVEKVVLTINEFFNA